MRYRTGDSVARPSVLLATSVTLLVASLLISPAARAQLSCFGESATILGTQADDKLRGTQRRDVIVALGGDDRVTGLGGNDRICGGRGDDRILGGRGADSVEAGGGYDSVSGGRGTDLLIGGGAGDVLSGGRRSDVLRGSRGADLLLGRAGRDRLFGNGGADVLTPSRGADISRGGRGSDTISFAASARRVTVDLAAGFARGEGRDSLHSMEHAIGSEQNDLLRGTHSRDLLIGLSGNDTLVGRRGHDVLEPGSGRDTLRGGRGRDLASYLLSPRRVEVDLARKTRFFSIEGLQGSTGSDFLKGTWGPDVIVGGDGEDWIAGRGGRDRIRGGAGNDILRDGSGSDRVAGNAGRDEFVSGEGDDKLWGGAQRDSIDLRMARTGVSLDLAAGLSEGLGSDRVSSIDLATGSRFDDQLYGSAAPNSLSGEEGDDLLVGRGSRDTLRGGNGVNRLVGEDGDDSLFGGVDVDTIEGGAGADLLSASEGNDFLVGGPGDDSVYTAAGDDRVHAGDGDDRVAPEQGNDDLDGGAGRDSLDLIDGPAADVDLLDGSATVGGESVLVLEFENVLGSRFADDISGDEGSNGLAGGDGADRLVGRGGDDALSGGRGEDFGDGGSGVDKCTNIQQHVSCEMLDPGPPPLTETRPSPTPSPSREVPYFAPRDATEPDPAPTTTTSVTHLANPSRTASLPDVQLPSPLAERWTRPFEDWVSYPVIAEGRVFVMTGLFGEVATVEALSVETGETLWSATSEERGHLSYDSGTLYLVTVSGRVRAFDPTTGAVTLDETIPHHPDVTAPPAIDGDDMFIPTREEGVIAMSAATGAVRWGREYSSTETTGIAVSGSRVYVASQSSARALDRQDATPWWRFSGTYSVWSSEIPRYHDGRIYLPAAGHVVDARTGEEVGRFGAPSSVALARSIGVFLVNNPGGSEQLRADHLYGDGNLWTFEGDGSLAHSPLIVGDTVYVASYSNLYALDLSTGRLLWSSTLRDPPDAGMAAGDGILVVANRESLTAFGAP